jgi:hypothetical protein
LGGALTVSLVDGFIPSPGQSFTFLTAVNVIGGFSTVSLPSMPGLIFDVVYNPQSVVLKVSAAFTADFDDDGDVDAADLAEWRGDFALNADSDADDDGDSDGGDLLVWQRQAGGGVPEVVASQGVPEPASLVLLCLSAPAVTAGAVRRFRRAASPADS